MASEITEIYDSNKKDYKIYKTITLIAIVICNIIIPLYVFVLAPITQEGVKCEGVCISMMIFLFFSTNITLLVVLNNFRITFTPAKYIEIIFTDSEFEIYLQKRLYFRQSSNELRMIEIIKEKNSPEYDVNFLGREKRTIRLTRIIIHEKKRKEVLTTIQQWGKELSIPVNQLVIKKIRSKEWEQDRKELQKWFKKKV